MDFLGRFVDGLLFLGEGELYGIFLSMSSCIQAVVGSMLWRSRLPMGMALFDVAQSGRSCTS